MSEYRTYKVYFASGFVQTVTADSHTQAKLSAEATQEKERRGIEGTGRLDDVAYYRATTATRTECVEDGTLSVWHHDPDYHEVYRIGHQSGTEAPRSPTLPTEDRGNDPREERR